MTSQVVLMNSIGAALASDSVVTIGETNIPSCEQNFGIGEATKLQS